MEDSAPTPACDNAMGTGIAEIDAADRRLSALVDGLNQAIADGQQGEEMRRLTNQLLLEAISHFETEERLLSECAYPLPKGHAGLHRQMRSELEHAMEALRQVEGPALRIEYGLLVQQIFVEHMRQEATQFGNFLRSGSPNDAQGS